MRNYLFPRIAHNNERIMELRGSNKNVITFFNDERAAAERVNIKAVLY